VLVLFLAGCGEGDRGSARVAGGALDQVRVVAQASMEVLGSSDHLSGIRDLEFAADGSVWVLNTAAPFFVVFDREGRELGQAGVRGGGPSEFQAPSALVRLGPAIWAYDRARHGFTRLDPGGTGEIVSLPRDRLPPSEVVTFGEPLAPGANWVASLGDRVLLARGPDPSTTDFSVAGLWEAVFVAFDPATLALETVLEPGTLLTSPAGHYPDQPVLAPVPLWAPCREGDLAWYDPVGNRVGRTEPASGVAREGMDAPRPVDLPAPRSVPMTADALFTYYHQQMVVSFSADAVPPEEDLRRDFEGEFAEYRHRIADVLPEYVDLRCAGDGVLWIRLLEIETGPFARGGHWVRVRLPPATGGPDGGEARILETVRLPDGFRPLRITGDAVWGAWFDPLEVPHLARIPLTAVEER
jgi:hypothetical protein